MIRYSEGEPWAQDEPRSEATGLTRVGFVEMLASAIYPYYHVYIPSWIDVRALADVHWRS